MNEEQGVFSIEMRYHSDTRLEFTIDTLRPLHDDFSAELMKLVRNFQKLEADATYKELSHDNDMLELKVVCLEGIIEELKGGLKKFANGKGTKKLEATWRDNFMIEKKLRDLDLDLDL